MWVRSQNEKALTDAVSIWIEPGKDFTLLKCSIGENDSETIGKFATEEAALEELDRIALGLCPVQIRGDK